MKINDSMFTHLELRAQGVFWKSFHEDDIYPKI